MTDEVLNPDDPLMKTDEVAQIFGVTRETIRDWIANGTINAVKFGSRWYVRRSEVKRFVQSKYLEEE